MFLRRRTPPQGTVGEFLSTEETRGDLFLAAIINDGKTKIFASQPPVRLSSYEARFPGGLKVVAEGDNQSVCGGGGATRVEVISPYGRASI